MKQLRMFCMTSCAALSLLLASCGGNTDESTATISDSTQMETDTTAMTSPPMAVSYAVDPPYNLLVVKHKVADFDKWQTAYDAHDSARTAAGVHNYVISREVPDSNTVLVAMKADDLDKAMAFSKDPGLKTAMKNGGVTGAPDIHFYKIVYDATNTLPTDIRVVRNVKVKDWDTWKKAFESDHQLRMDNGMEDRSYGYDANDNHNVMVVYALTDTAKANQFMKSDTMKQKMEEAGVVGKPESMTIHIVKRY